MQRQGAQARAQFNAMGLALIDATYFGVNRYAQLFLSLSEYFVVDDVDDPATRGRAVHEGGRAA